jgi:hypothetical protein
MTRSSTVKYRLLAGKNKRKTIQATAITQKIGRKCVGFELVLVSIILRSDRFLIPALSEPETA